MLGCYSKAQKLNELAVYVQRRFVADATRRRDEVRNILDAARGPAAGENEDSTAVLRTLEEEDEESDLPTKTMKRKMQLSPSIRTTK